MQILVPKPCHLQILRAAGVIPGSVLRCHPLAVLRGPYVVLRVACKADVLPVCNLSGPKALFFVGVSWITPSTAQGLLPLFPPWLQQIYFKAMEGPFLAVVTYAPLALPECSAPVWGLVWEAGTNRKEKTDNSTEKKKKTYPQS